MKSSNQAIPLTERPTLTVDEFCKLIGIGRSTAYKAIAAGDLKVRKYGSRTFVTQDERKRFVDNMPSGTTRSSAHDHAADAPL